MNQMKIACQNCVFARAKAFKSSITFFVTPCIDFQMVDLLTIKMVETTCTFADTLEHFVRYV